tara:strand:- start:358 stop:783 length:426 start_codon:yes stop_codon:yes gene_type:complete
MCITASAKHYLPRCGLPIAILLVANTIAAGAETPSIDCDGQQYSFKHSLFGATAKKMDGAEWQDFCVPENPETLTQTLTIREDEIWCLSYHHITSDTQPFARQSWILNTEIGTLQIADYVRRNGAWLKQSQRRIKCQMPAG